MPAAFLRRAAFSLYQLPDEPPPPKSPPPPEKSPPPPLAPPPPPQPPPHPPELHQGAGGGRARAPLRRRARALGLSACRACAHTMMKAIEMKNARISNEILPPVAGERLAPLLARCLTAS